MTDEVFYRWVRGVLAGIVTLGFFAIIVGLMLMKDIPAGVKDVLLVMLGALLASYKEVTGYFFGSSTGSAVQRAALVSAVTTPPIVTITPAAMQSKPGEPLLSTVTRPAIAEAQAIAAANPALSTIVPPLPKA